MARAEPGKPAGKGNRRELPKKLIDYQYIIYKITTIKRE
jgi:hypothetical protein